MTIKQRLAAPTPPFFKKLRNAGLLLASISGALLTTPLGLPAIVVRIAGYLAVAAAVVSTVSQAVTTDTSTEKTGKDGE